MSHARKQIRDTFITALTGLTTTGTKVFKSRVHNITDSEMPCLLVFSKDETNNRLTLSTPRRQERDLTIIIEGCLKTNSNFDDLADTIAKEVEIAIYNNNSLKVITKDIMLTDTELKMMGEAEKPIAVISMKYLVKYHVIEGDPENTIN